MRLILSFLALVNFINFAHTQQALTSTPFSISVDVSRFKYSGDSSLIEINYAVYPTNITLEKIQDTVRGGVVIQTTIIDSVKGIIMDRSTVSMPIIIRDTSSYQSGYLWKSMHVLPVGDYNIIVKSYDEKAVDRKDSIGLKLSIKSYSNTPSISDIDLCSRIASSNDKDNLFYKNSYEVVPNPSLLFGGKISPVVFSYSEIYNVNPEQSYLVISGIMDRTGSLIKKQKRIHRYKAKNVVDVGSLNVYSTPSGIYRYVLILADTSENEIARSEKMMYIYNPHIQSTSPKLTTAISNFLGLSEKDITDEFNKMRYIVSTDDIKAFRQLKTLEAKREFLANCWKEIETGLRGSREVTRAFYLDRVNTASQRFRSMGKEGWQTDRGRIFILYGDPDEIQRFPSSENVKPYEIWYYNQLEGGIYFVFVDRSGFGEYILVHSTKRGEIWDESWQRNLQ